MSRNNRWGIVEQLDEAERAQYDALDRTPAPEALAHEWKKPATVGWVKRYVDMHYRWCPALFLLRKLAITALTISAFVMVFQIVGLLAGKAMFRAAVREILIEEGLVRPPAPPMVKGTGS